MALSHFHRTSIRTYIFKHLQHKNTRKNYEKKNFKKKKKKKKKNLENFEKFPNFKNFFHSDLNRARARGRRRLYTKFFEKNSEKNFFFEIS